MNKRFFIKRADEDGIETTYKLSPFYRAPNRTIKPEKGEKFLQVSGDAQKALLKLEKDVFDDLFKAKGKLMEVKRDAQSAFDAIVNPAQKRYEKSYKKLQDEITPQLEKLVGSIEDQFGSIEKIERVAFLFKGKSYNLLTSLTQEVTDVHAKERKQKDAATLLEFGKTLGLITKKVIEQIEGQIDIYNNQFPEKITKKIVQLNLFDPTKAEEEKLAFVRFAGVWDWMKNAFNKLIGFFTKSTSELNSLADEAETLSADIEGVQVESNIETIAGRLVREFMNKQADQLIDSVFADDGHMYQIRQVHGKFYLYKDGIYAGKHFARIYEARKFLRGLNREQHPAILQEQVQPFANIKIISNTKAIVSSISIVGMTEDEAKAIYYDTSEWTITSINTRTWEDMGVKPKKTRVYIFEKETVIENICNRYNRPWRVYKELLSQVCEQLNIQPRVMNWSQLAGCSCGCSPGFILDRDYGYSVYVDVTPPKINIKSSSIVIEGKDEQDMLWRAHGEISRQCGCGERAADILEQAVKKYAQSDWTGWWDGLSLRSRQRVVRRLGFHPTVAPWNARRILDQGYGSEFEQYYNDKVKSKIQAEPGVQDEIQINELQTSGNIFSAKKKIARNWKVNIDIEEEFYAIENDYNADTLNDLVQKLKGYVRHIEAKIGRDEAAEFEAVLDILGDSIDEDDFDSRWEDLYDTCDAIGVWLNVLGDENYIYLPGEPSGITKSDIEKLKEIKKKAVTPEGWEEDVKEMKKNPKIDNPWALAWWMKNKGYRPHRKSSMGNTHTPEVYELMQRLEDKGASDEEILNTFKSKGFNEFKIRKFIEWWKNEPLLSKAENIQYRPHKSKKKIALNKKDKIIQKLKMGASEAQVEGQDVHYNMDDELNEGKTKPGPDVLTVEEKGNIPLTDEDFGILDAMLDEHGVDNLLYAVEELSGIDESFGEDAENILQAYVKKKAGEEEEEEFKNGDKVYLKGPYVGDTRGERFILSQWDGNKGWIGDKYGRGWYVHKYQITKKGPKKHKWSNKKSDVGFAKFVDIWKGHAYKVLSNEEGLISLFIDDIKMPDYYISFAQAIDEAKTIIDYDEKTGKIAASKEWLGTPPSNCDICGEPITDEFIDGKTRMGLWANMCPKCFKQNGVGLGTGKGQKYQNKDNKWIKIKGAKEKQAQGTETWYVDPDSLSYPIEIRCEYLTEEGEVIKVLTVLEINSADEILGQAHDSWETKPGDVTTVIIINAFNDQTVFEISAKEKTAAGKEDADERLVAATNPIVGEDKYIDFDESTNDWGIFGTESGFCYELYSSKAEAERVLQKQADTKTIMSNEADKTTSEIDETGKVTVRDQTGNIIREEQNSSHDKAVEKQTTQGYKTAGSLA